MVATELYPKRLQLLKEVIPQLAKAAVLWNPDHPSHAKAVEELKGIALAFNRIEFVGVRTPEQFHSAFSDITRANARALYLVEDSIFFAHQLAPSKAGIRGPDTNHPRTGTLA